MTADEAEYVPPSTVHKIRKAQDGQFYVVEVAGNNEVLNTSETFPRHDIAVANAQAAGATVIEDDFDEQ